MGNHICIGSSIEFVSPDKTTAKMALGENIEKLLDSLGLIT